MSRHRMAPGDVAWLHMDRPTNRMIVNSVMWTDEPLDWQAIRALLQTRLIDRFPRFSQRVVDHLEGVWWSDVEFDLDDHIVHAALPAPGGSGELQQYVSDQLREPLDRSRPLWEMHFIEGYRGGSAILSRIHHCIADGVALSRVMLSMTDDPNVALQANVARRESPRHGPLAGSTGVVDALASDLRHPGRVAGQSRAALAGGRALAHLVAMSPDAQTSLRGKLGKDKTVVWSEPIPLHLLTGAAHAAGVTLNDLLLCAVSGAVRALLERRDGRAPDVRAVLPVNLRPPDAPLPTELGNDFGLVYLQLPVATQDLHERLAEVHRRTSAMDIANEAVITFRILGLTGHTSYRSQQVFVDLFATKASAVITNVPGPTHPVFLAGRRVRGTIGWPPESGNLGLGVSIISYDGDVVVGLMTDDQLLDAPRPLLDDITRELERLVHLQAAAR